MRETVNPMPVIFVALFCLVVSGCTHQADFPTCVTPDATYIAVVESTPSINGEIRATDTLRLVFDYNIDGYDYCADCEYYFWFSYRRTDRVWTNGFFNDLRERTAVQRGRLTATMELSRIYSDTVYDPPTFAIGMAKVDEGRTERICTKLLEYRLAEQ